MLVKIFVCRLCLLINFFFSVTQKISAFTIVLLNMKSLIFDFKLFLILILLFSLLKPLLWTIRPYYFCSGPYCLRSHLSPPLTFVYYLSPVRLLLFLSLFLSISLFCFCFCFLSVLVHPHYFDYVICRSPAWIVGVGEGEGTLEAERGGGGYWSGLYY